MVFMHGLTIASVDCDQESHLLDVTTDRNRGIPSRESKDAPCGAGGSGREAPPGSDGDVTAAMATLAPAYVHRVEPDRLRDLMTDTVFSASAMNRGFEVLSTWISVDRLASITAPTLVIAGRHDPFTSWPQAHRIAAHVPDAEVIVFEHSSHFPWLDEPEAFLATTRQWLERQGLLP